MSTVYFGWHYLLDDIAGLAIGYIAVWIGAKVTGHEMRPIRDRSVGDGVIGVFPPESSRAHPLATTPVVTGPVIGGRTIARLGPGHVGSRMTDAADALVSLRVAAPVATVTLDSPHNRNALSRRLVDELMAALGSADADPDVRVVVLTHTGSTFCAGADMAEAVADGMERGSQALLDLLRLVVSLPTPVVADIRGHVRAGGVGLVGACDLALVTDASTFAFSEARIGLAPAIISLTTRGRLGERDAARKYLSGVVFDGVEAARSGLVTDVVAAGESDAALATLLDELTGASPQGLRETKALLNAPLLRRIDDEGPALVALSARLFASDEAREGMQAFRERRAPRWSGDSPTQPSA